jgi:DNA-binding transcriptional LysR family regulator
MAANSPTEFNWNDLKYFLTVVRTGNPARAAKSLGVDHTTVRRRVHTLETQLGATLFTKHDENYGLTLHGERLLKCAESIESNVIATRNALAETELSLSGTIRIGAPDGLGSYFLAPRLAKLRRAHPELKIELAAMSRQFNLSKREADIAIVISRPPPSRHIIRKLVDCTLYLYASTEYLARHPPIESVHDLHEHQFIGYPDQIDFTPVLDSNSAVFEELSNPILASTNLVAQYKATVAGGGLCLLPRFMFEEGESLRQILPNEVSVTREHWLLIHADMRNIARCRKVSDFIMEEVTRDCHLFN